jgi:triosephosphate isomerase (TIM)
MRTTYIVGNWKMNQNLKEINSFFEIFDAIDFTPSCESWISAQAIHLQYLMEKARVKKNIKVGSQDVSAHRAGAYTGELNAESIKDLGAHFTLVGHSERRAYHNEDNTLLNAKVKKALASDLKVIYCIGETLEQREAGITFDVIKKQLSEGLVGVSFNCENLIIAYEPVWAIGTGKTATPKMAGEVHSYIRGILKTHGKRAESISLIYGGSVKPSNIEELLRVKDIDGALVGGASLKAGDFSALCQAGS